MITQVGLENLRGIREGKLEGLRELTVLVGPNSSGKSTILDALLIGGGRQPGAAAGYSVRRRAGMRYGARWLLWRGQGELSAGIVLEFPTGTTRTARIAWHDEADLPELRRRLAELGREGPYSSVAVRVTTGPKGGEVTGTAVFAADNTYQASDDSARSDAPALAETWLVDLRLGHEFAGIAEPTAGWRGQRLAQPAAGSATPANSTLGIHAQARELSELYSRVTERGRKQAVLDILTAVVPGLEAIEILTEHNDPRLYLTFADHSVPVALAGDGVQALVRISLELASRPGGSVLLEEPEAHQHPAAIRASAQAIVEAVRRGVQVVLSTHSLELIDALLEALDVTSLDLLSLYRLKLDGGLLKTSRLAGAEVQLARRAIEEDLR